MPEQALAASKTALGPWLEPGRQDRLYQRHVASPKCNAHLLEFDSRSPTAAPARHSARTNSAITIDWYAVSPVTSNKSESRTCRWTAVERGDRLQPGAFTGPSQLAPNFEAGVKKSSLSAG